MIKAITFDFWDTLYEGRTVNAAERLRHLQGWLETGSGTTLLVAELAAAVAVARQAWDQAWYEAQRTMGAAEWIGIVTDRLGLTLPAAALSQMVLALENSLLDYPPILAPEARQVLAQLSAHYRLAVISDTGLTPGRVLKLTMDRDEISGYFSYFTFSDELGTSKPHPNNFRHTLEKLGAESHEAIHVGDLLRTDVAGANGVGMRSVQYIGLKHVQIPAGIEPDAVIANHNQLFPLLDRWNAVS